MGKTKYRYNPETCQYERVGLTFLNVLWYGAGVIAVGSLVFAGLLIGTDQVIESNQEKLLHAENNALKKYKVILASQLNEIEATVEGLGEKDKAIYQQLFDVSAQDDSPKDNRSEKRRILHADAPDFQILLTDLKSTTGKLNQKSAFINDLFSNLLSMRAEDAVVLQTLPTLFPIEQQSMDLAISGFGERINPFHKGKYMHPGIDIAAPRGAMVFSTAPGKISIVKHSSLQAGYGTYIEINHGNGFITRYAHLEDTKVRTGESVLKGQPIATVGSSGGSIAPHLHYEIIHNGTNVDPVFFMVEGLNSNQYSHLVSLSSRHNQSFD